MHDSASIAGPAFIKEALDLCRSFACFVSVTGHIDDGHK
jgi:hypothetical protein